MIIIIIIIIIVVFSRWHASLQAGNLLTAVLQAAVGRVLGSMFGDLRQAQLRTLLEAAARHEEAPRFLGSLAASPCFAALVPSGPSTLDRALVVAEGTLTPFVEHATPAPRLESLCVAHLLRSLPGASLPMLGDAVRFLSRVGSLEEMPSVTVHLAAALADATEPGGAGDIRSDAMPAEMLELMALGACVPSPNSEPTVSRFRGPLLARRVLASAAYGIEVLFCTLRARFESARCWDRPLAAQALLLRAAHADPIWSEFSDHMTNWARELEQLQLAHAREARVDHAIALFII